MMLDTKGDNKNRIMQYDYLTVDDIKKHAKTYLNTQSRQD